MNKRTLSYLLAIILLASIFTTILYVRESYGQSLTWSLDRVVALDPAFEAEIVKVQVLDESKGIILAETNRPQIFLVNAKFGNVTFIFNDFTIPFGLTKNEDMFSAFSEGGRFIAWIDSENKLRVFDILKNKLSVINLNYRANAQPISVDVSKNGVYIVIGDRLGFLAIYKRAVDSLPEEFPSFLVDFPFFTSEAPAYTPPFTYQNIHSKSSGPWVIAAGDNSKAALYDSKGNKILSPSITGKILDSAISYDGNYFVLGGEEDRVYFFSKSSPLPLWSYTANNDVLALGISSNGNEVVAGTKFSGNMGGQIMFWKDAKGLTGTPSPTWAVNTGDSVNDVDIDAYGGRIAAVSSNNKVFFYNKDGTQVWSPYTGTKPFIKVDLSENGKYLIAANDDKQVFFFGDSSNTPLWTKTLDKRISSLSISFLGDFVFIGAEDKLLFVKASGDTLWEARIDGNVVDSKLNHDGSFAVVGTSSEVLFFNTDRKSPQWTFHGRGDDVIGDLKSVDISADGNIVAIGYKKNVALWTSATELFHGDNGPSPDWTQDLSANVNTVKVNAIYESIVLVKNTGESNIILKFSTNLVYSSSNKIFTGFLNRIQLEDGTIYRVDWKSNSGTIPIGKEVKLFFKPPKEGKNSPTSGNYNAHVTLEGLNKDGIPFIQELNLGTITI
ncbi:MAG: WD40 repeat domain-containing protein [Nitrososphaerales archaeon]